MSFWQQLYINTLNVPRIKYVHSIVAIDTIIVQCITVTVLLQHKLKPMHGHEHYHTRRCYILCLCFFIMEAQAELKALELDPDTHEEQMTTMAHQSASASPDNHIPAPVLHERQPQPRNS